MQLHNLDNLMETREIFYCSGQGSDTAGVAVHLLPTSQWLLEAPAKFLKQKFSHAAHMKSTATQSKYYDSWFNY